MSVRIENNTVIDEQAEWLMWEERFSLARQSSFPDITKVSSPSVKWLLAHNASQLACHEEALFIPLLTCCAHMMGVNTSIKVNDHWSEPCILWTTVCSRRGTGKTAILKQLIRPLLDLQCEHERQWHLSRPSSSQSSGSSTSPPKLLSGPTSLAELYKILGKNGGQMLTFEENLENLHNHLLTDQNGELISGDELNNLYDAMPKFSSKDGEVSIMTTTCYNHCGMASPQYIMELFRNKRLCLFDRYLIACPNDIRRKASPPTPGSTKIPTIKSIFQTMYMFHRQSREYVFNSEAVSELEKYIDNDLPKYTAQFKLEELTRLAVAKCPGQIVRLAGIIKSLTTACIFASQVNGLQFIKWNLTIDRQTVIKAILLQKYFLEQKLILLHGVTTFSDISIPSIPSRSFQVAQSTSQSPAAESSVTSFMDGRSPTSSEYLESFLPDFVSMAIPQFVSNFSNKIRRLLEYADDGNGIPASVAAQYSIPPIVHIPGSTNKKPTWVAELFFKKVAELGIGRLCYVKHHAKFYLRFMRKRIEELTETDRQLLENLRVDLELFSRVGNETICAAEVYISPIESSVSPFSMDSQLSDRSPYPVNFRPEQNDTLEFETVPVVKKEIIYEEQADTSDNPHSSI